MKRWNSGLLLVVAMALAAGCTTQTFDVEVDELLEVVSIVPHNGASEVALNEDGTLVDPITVHFSDPVAVGSLTQASGGVELLRGREGQEPVRLDFTPDLDTQAMTTLTVVPDDPLEYSTTYTLRLTGFIERKDRLGSLEGTVVTVFTTEGAPEAFEVSSTWPADGTEEVPLADAGKNPIRPMVFFNHAVDLTADWEASFEVLDVADNAAIDGTWSINDSGQRAVFTPDADWRHGQQVQVSVLEGLTDSSDEPRALRETVRFSFTFAPEVPTPFKVLSTTPADGATDLAVAGSEGEPSQVVIFFSDAVDDTEDWSASLFVRDADSGLAIPGAWWVDPATSSAVFAPSLPWDYGQSVEVTAIAGLPGAGGGTLADDYRFRFSFTSAPGFWVVSTYPLDGADDVQPVGATSLPTAIEVFFNDTPAEVVDWDEHFHVVDVTVPGSEVDLGGAGSWTIDPEQASAVFRLEAGQFWSFSQAVRLRVDAGLEGERGGVLGRATEVSFRFASPTELLIMRTEPPDGGQRIPLYTPGGAVTTAEVFFNEPLEPTQDWLSHLDLVEVLPGGPAAVPGEWALGAGNRSVVFTPDTTWHYGSTVQATVTPGLLGLSGSELEEGTTFSFVFEEPPPLAVVSIAPADGAERVPREAAGAPGSPTEIRILFSEGVNQSSATLTTSTTPGTVTVADPTTGDPIPGALFFEEVEPSTVDSTAIFHATDPWPYSQPVQVTVGYQVESDRGARLGEGQADNVQSSFFFEDPPALLLLSRLPAPLAPDVLIGTDISWKFSRALDMSSVTTQNLRVWLDSDLAETNLCTGAEGTLSADVAETTITCDPIAAFPEGERVWVELSAGLGGIQAGDATSRGGWLDEGTADLLYSFDVKPAPELGIVAAFPAIDPDGQPARNVDPNAVVRVVFDRPVDRPSIDDASFIVRECVSPAPCPDAIGGADLPATQTCAAGDNCIAFGQADAEVSWTHGTRFEYQTFYTVIVGDTIFSADGQARVPTPGYTYSFETAPPPTMSVVNTVPADGATDLTRRPTILIHYDMDIDANSLMNDPAGGDGLLPNVFINAGGESDRAGELEYGVDYTVSLADASSVQVELLRNLELGTTYTVTTTMDLRNVETGGLQVPHHFQFSVRSDGLLISVTPADGTTGVPVLGTVVEALFREPMDESTISENTFGLLFKDRHGRIHSVPGTVSYDGDAQKATFTPDESSVGHCDDGMWPLIYGTQYDIRLSPRIASAAGETLGPEVHGFTTVGRPGIVAIRSEGALPGKTVDDRAQLDGAVDVPQNSTLIVEFDEPMDPASFTAGGTPGPNDTVVLEWYPPADEPQVPTLMAVLLDYTDTPRPTLKVEAAGLLLSSTRHVLRIKGKDLGNASWVTTASGQPLRDTVAPSFRSASNLTAKLTLAVCPECCGARCRWSGTPPDEKWSCSTCDCPLQCKPPYNPPDPDKTLLSETPFQNGVISVAFNRPVDKASVEAGFSVTVNTFARLCNYNYPQVLGRDTAQSVSCEPQSGGIGPNDEVRVIVTTEVIDEQGNPLQTPIDEVLDPAATSAGASPGPLVIPSGTSGTPRTVYGDQVFLAAWPLHAWVRRVVSDADRFGVDDPDPASLIAGDAYIANNWKTSSFKDGYLYEWDGSDWHDMLGRQVDYGDWVLVDPSPDPLSSFAGRGNQLLQYQAWTLNYNGVFWWQPLGSPRTGWQVYINGEYNTVNGYYTGATYRYTAGGWVYDGNPYQWPRDRIDPATVHGGSLADDPAGASIALFDEDAGDAFAPVFTKFVPVRDDGFDFPDWVQFWPVTPLTHGHLYRIEIRGLTMIKNIAGNNLDADVTRWVRVEDAAPGVDAIEARYWDDMVSRWDWKSIAASPSDVPADARIRIAFTEKIDMDSAQDEVFLQEAGGAEVPATLELYEDPDPPGDYPAPTDFALLLTPEAPLEAAKTYQVVVTDALLDVTGKAKGGVATINSFTIENLPMTVPRTSPDGVNTALDAQVTIFFSDPVDPLTFRSGNLEEPADNPPTLWLEHVAEADGPNPCGTLTTPFCVTFADNLRQVFLTPVGPGLLPYRKYNVVFDTDEVYDLAGTLIDPGYGPLEFETVLGPPSLLCTIPDHETLITRADPIEVHFSEAVDLTSLQDEARLVSRTTGLEAAVEFAEITDAGGTPIPGSYTITPAAGEPLDPATVYWLEASSDVLDTALLDGLFPPYYATFTTHGLMINEVLFDPPGIAADANCDGVSDEDDDEFVELVNIGADPVDISGWTLESTSLGLRHTFAGGTTVAAHGVVLVFGGGTPGTACFPGVTLLTADSGLGLQTTDGLVLKDLGGAAIDSVMWDHPSGLDQSLVRDPDGTGEFVVHSGAAGADGAIYSPGTRSDGTAH